MLKTLLVACSLFCGAVALCSGIAFAMSQGSVTWGTSNYYLPDGSICDQLVGDGGFVDGGPTLPDGGPFGDGGYPQDGGWIAGSGTVLANSDPVPTEQSYKATCNCLTPGANSAANVCMQLQGSTDLAISSASPWVAYPNTSVCLTPDGGNNMSGGWIQYAGNVAKWTRIQDVSNNSDGGGASGTGPGPLCCCTYEAQ